MPSRWAIAGAAILTCGIARAAGPGVEGEYDSPLGRVRIVGQGARYRGVLTEASASCGFREGEEVLRATLLDDSLAGQVRVCLRGKGCQALEEWSSAVLLVRARSLSGAVHVASKGCTSPLGKRGSLSLARAAAKERALGAAGVEAGGPSSKGAAPSAARVDGAVRARAREVMRDGAAFLGEGRFEAARGRFLAAIDIDDRIPEAYNGVGITYRMRNDLPSALEWYKKALEIDPDFGDAYYNMACVYALQGRKELALRYLQIAALNGYATAEGMDEDPDLGALRGEPAYRALIRARM